MNKKEYDKQYYQTNKEKKKAYDKQYAKTHREQRNKLCQKWRTAHPTELAIILHKSYLKHRNEKREYGRKRNETQKLEIIKYLGSKCSKCGYDKCFWALELHHTSPEVKEKSSSWKHYDLSKVILVCANCHREIHYELKQKEIKDFSAKNE